MLGLLPFHSHGEAAAKSFRSSGEQPTEGEVPRYLLIGVSNLNAMEEEETMMKNKNWTSKQSSGPSRGMFSRKMRPLLKLICGSSWNQQRGTLLPVDKQQ
jgi:hypothetical protein